MIKRLERLYALGLCIIFAGIVVHTPLTVWLGIQYPSAALWIKSWKEMLMFVLAVVAIWLVTHHKLWREFSRDWLFRLIVAYAAVHLILVVTWWHGMQQTLAGLGIDLRYILFFALVYLLVKIAPTYKKVMINIAIGGAVIVTGFATVQYFLPADILKHIGYSDQTIRPYQTVDRNPNYIRVNSTLRGPNPLGAYAAATLAIAVAYVATRKREKLHPIIGAIGLNGSVALWLSYSRSAIVAACIGIAIVIAGGMKKISPIVWKTGGVLLLIVLALAVVARDSNFFQTVILHNDPTTVGITSNEDHVSSLQEGTERLLQQPFGGGIGSTGSASLLGTDGIIIENQYLFIAHETGWIGLALFLSLFGILLHRLFIRRRQWLALGMFASGISLAAIGVLLPVWTDDTVSIVWWGLAAIAIGEVYGKSRQNK